MKRKWQNQFGRSWLEQRGFGEGSAPAQILALYDRQPERRQASFWDFYEGFSRFAKNPENRSFAQRIVTHLVACAIEELVSVKLKTDRFTHVQEEVLMQGALWLDTIAAFIPQSEDNPLRLSFAGFLKEHAATAKSSDCPELFKIALEELAQLVELAESSRLIYVKNAYANSTGGGIKQCGSRSGRQSRKALPQ